MGHVAGEPISGPALEIGAGYGYFAERLRRMIGVSVDVVEPSKTAQERMLAGSFDGLIFDTIADIDRGRTYSEIFCFHVVEHLQEIDAFFSQVASLLRADGRLWILTPNGASVSFRKLGAKWGWRCPEQHYVFLAQTTPPEYFRKFGLTLLLQRDVQPGIIHYPSYWRELLIDAASALKRRCTNANPFIVLSRKVAKRLLLYVSRLFDQNRSSITFSALEAVFARCTHERPYDELMLVLRRTPNAPVYRRGN
jgi:SAM-dependent methyltransferase